LWNFDGNKCDCEIEISSTCCFLSDKLFIWWFFFYSAFDNHILRLCPQQNRPFTRVRWPFPKAWLVLDKAPVFSLKKELVCKYFLDVHIYTWPRLGVLCYSFAGFIQWALILGLFTRMSRVMHEPSNNQVFPHGICIRNVQENISMEWRTCKIPNQVTQDQSWHWNVAP
jgi:hypothetical protein